MGEPQNIQLQFLGPLLISSPQSIPPLRRKTRAILAYLAITNRSHTRRHLMDLFCQEAADPSRALAVLLSRIRKLLGKDALHTKNRSIQLNVALVSVDVLTFQEFLGGDVADQSIERVEAAVLLYRGDLLSGLTLNDAPEFELWLLAQRAQMRHLLERGLMRLVSDHVEQNQLDVALRYAQQLVQHNPLLENAHSQLIWLYAQTGQRDAALQQYVYCRELLQRELAVEPGELLQKLASNLEADQPFPTQAVHKPAVSEPSTPVASDFVGRAAELNLLQAAWPRVKTGSGAVIVIAAQAGGGKTRLVEEFVRKLPQSAVLTGRCYESSHALPYEPWLGMLEQHLQRLNDKAIKQLSLQTRTFIGRLLPQLVRGVPPHVSRGTFTEAEQLYTAVVDFLTQSVDGQSPQTVFFLDDLQWADEASLRLFHYLAQRSDRLPWLLIGSYRPEEAAQSPPLLLLLNDLARRRVTKISMPPLTLDEVTELIGHLWPGLSIAQRPAVAEKLRHTTGGNALFVTAVLRELAHTDIVPKGFPIPASVQDLIVRHLHRLPEGCRQVWEGLAVWGNAAAVSPLQFISGRSMDEVVQAVELGLQAGMIGEKSTASVTTYVFHHDLVREAVLTVISTVRQQRLHYRSALWLSRLAERQPAAAQDEIAGRIVVHAKQGEGFLLLFRWASKAAAHARHMFAYHDALTLLETGIEAFNHCQLDPDFDIKAGEIILFSLMIEWLSYCDMVGKPEAQIESFLEQATQLHNRHPAPERAANLHLTQANLNPDHRQGIVEARQAFKQFGQLGQPQMAATALVSAAARHLSLSENKNSQRVFSEALELYQQIGDVPGQVLSLSGLGWVALNLGEVALALKVLEQALGMSRERGDRLGEAQTLYVMTAAWGFYHAPEQMMKLANEAIEIYDQIGFAVRANRPLMYIGLAHDTRGDVDRALSIYERVLEEASRRQDTWLVGWVSQLIGRIFLERGDAVTAAKHLQKARQTRILTGEVQNQVSDLAWLGRLALAQGNVQEALKLTDQAVSQLDNFYGEFYVWEQPDVLRCRAEALAAAGQFAAAETIAQRARITLQRFADQIDDPVLRKGYFAYRRNAAVRTAVFKQ
ncbi:MAG: AAA family ATPase [Ardenticatenaceae bacterium]|nr:AAA family ATPase [Ardenticatenaceae bacterium]